MVRVATRSKMSAEDYLAWEQAQPTKHEYFHGDVFAMSGASTRHNILCGNVITALNVALRARGCVVMTSDQRVTAENHGRYVYPDVSVVCGKLEVEPNEVLVNPTVVVEVLSASTEQYDRGLKWGGYQGISSLQDYVLVAQAEPRIEHYRRAADGSWTYRAARAGQRMTLSIGAVLDLDELYAGVLEVPGDETG